MMILHFAFRWRIFCKFRAIFGYVEPIAYKIEHSLILDWGQLEFFREDNLKHIDYIVTHFGVVTKRLKDHLKNRRIPYLLYCFCFFNNKVDYCCEKELHFAWVLPIRITYINEKAGNHHLKQFLALLRSLIPFILLTRHKPLQKELLDVFLRLFLLFCHRDLI